MGSHYVMQADFDLICRPGWLQAYDTPASASPNTGYILFYWLDKVIFNHCDSGISNIHDANRIER